MDLKKLIFISGKGGTGKTTLSVLLAKHLVQQGRRVLLVELGEHSSANSIAKLNIAPQYRPQSTSQGFFHSQVRGIDCLTEYVGSFTKLETLTRKFFETQFISSLINVAPGLNDLAVLGKLTSGFRNHGPAFDFDHIIVDGPSTGSFGSLIAAPRRLAESVSDGPLKVQSHGTYQVLCDPKSVQYFFIGLFETLPVDELQETLSGWQQRHSDQIQVVINKKLDMAGPSQGLGPWTDYINERVAQEQAQKKRLESFCKDYLTLSLITDDFCDFIDQLPGGFLRPV